MEISKQVAAIWPKPRQSRWRLGQLSPDQYPDLSDAFLYLDKHGIQVEIEESLSVPWNPLLNMHEFYSGLDPLRAFRVATRAAKYDAILCVGDATAFVLVWLRRVFGLRTAILLIDPALTPGYLRRKRLQDFVIPRVDKVVVYGNVQVDYLQREYGPSVKATFLHQKADASFFRPAELSSAAPAPYIFSIGLDESRDFETLSRAARLCRDELGMTHRFVLQTTRAVAEPGVLDIHSGAVTYPRLRQFYQEASVVVLPLHDRLHAGGITTLLEAMATGCAVVVSGSRGIMDYVIDGETARVVAPGDAEGMGHAIADLAANPQEARRLGANARRFVVERCDNSVFAASLADIIRDTVRGRPTRPQAPHS
jgi:glycosyltransferase involved in cell wall biosynthesis